MTPDCQRTSMHHDKAIHLSDGNLGTHAYATFATQRITTIEGIMDVTQDDILLSADVASLYTMMIVSHLYETLRLALHLPFNGNQETIDFVLDAVRFICEANYFQYGSRLVFKHLDGIAMGDTVSVISANLYMTGFDAAHAPRFRFYGRFTDDVCAIDRGSP